ncbi:MAG: acyl carrier protein [Planctomycetes bacterium]|nr:acyl carrier protein [Planctomycetota bacterium]
MEQILEQTESAIRKFIVDNFLFGQEDDQLTSEISLLQSGTIDSTGVLELVMFVEETYGIKIEDDELLPENLDSIRNVAEFVRRKQEHA